MGLSLVVTLVLFSTFLYYDSIFVDDISVKRNTLILGRTFQTLLEEAGPESDFSSLVTRFRNNLIGCVEIEKLFVLLPGKSVCPSKPSSFLSNLIEEAAAFPSEMRKLQFIKGKWISVQRLRPKGFGHVVLLLVLTDRNETVVINWYKWLLVGAVIFIIYSILTYYIIERNILFPADELALKVESVSRNRYGSLGNSVSHLSTDITHSSLDSIERVSLAIDSFYFQIGKIVDDVTEAVGAMASTCSEIEVLGKAAFSSVLCSERSVEETKVSLDEIRRSVEQSLKRIKDVVELSGKTDKIASSGHFEISRVLESIQVANKSVSSVSTVSKLIGTVADNASSLALKSAIEAARTNDSGSQIAVIAEEIKSLSDRLKEASKEIDAIVFVNSATLKNSTKLADNAAEKLNSIVEGVEGTSVLLSRVSGDMYLWESLINNVQRDVAGIDKAVKDNVNAVNKSKAVASQLLNKTVVVNRALDELSSGVEK